MRLTNLLLENPLGATASSYALSDLMCLNRARLPGRVDASGKRVIALGERDGAERWLEALWAIVDSDRLAHYPFYHAALAEYELQGGHR